MPTSFALRATTKSWRAANRAGAISCGASHSRVKSACKPTHSPTCNSPNHRRRPSRDGPPRSQHCVLSPSRQDTKTRLRRDTSVGLSAWLIVSLGRLPCALQVVACHLQSVSYLNTCQACNPGSEPVASHEQYITNKYAPSGLHEYGQPWSNYSDVNVRRGATDPLA